MPYNKASAWFKAACTLPLCSAWTKAACTSLAGFASDLKRSKRYTASPKAAAKAAATRGAFSAQNGFKSTDNAGCFCAHAAASFAAFCSVSTDKSSKRSSATWCRLPATGNAAAANDWPSSKDWNSSLAVSSLSCAASVQTNNCAASACAAVAVENCMVCPFRIGFGETCVS